MHDEPPNLVAAIAYGRRGWPAFAAKPQSKEPATRHGVKDATCDETELRRMWHRFPEANVAIACGAPGPQGLDIDDMVKGRDVHTHVAALGGPEAATARGRTLYLRGSSNGTVKLDYGELRGVGSYVIAPPSQHPDGPYYTWLNPPGVSPLPKVPEGIVAVSNGTAGTGELEPQELIPHGKRHDALKDFAIRQLRAGITDVPTLELLIRSYFAARCVPTPPPRSDEFLQIATWAAGTRMAERERMLAEVEDKPKKRSRGKTGLENAPRGDAPLAELRAFVGVAGGWGDRVDIDVVRRYGQRGVDPLTIRLTNGQLIEFDQQDEITTRGKWAKIVTAFTNGIAKPIATNERESLDVYRCLCILADAPFIVSQAETVEGTLREFCAMAEKWPEHDLSTPGGRWELIRRAHARGEWNPHKTDDEPPLLIVDRADGRLHVRAGEVLAYLNANGVRLASTMLAGRLGLIGFERWWCRGREDPRPDRPGQRNARKMVLYRLPDAWEEADQ